MVPRYRACPSAAGQEGGDDGNEAPCNFRAQIVIDVAKFAKTENGHETGPQDTDSSLDPTFGNDLSTKIRVRPPRGPKLAEKISVSNNFPKNPS